MASETVEAAAESGHQNLIAFSRVIAGFGTKGSLREDGGVLLYASGSWLPIGGNGAFQVSDDSVPAQLVPRADAFFGGLRRGYSVKVRDDGQDAGLQAACEASGLVAFGDSAPHMVCLQRLADPAPPDGVVLRRVTDAGGIADFVAVNAEAYATYGMPADVVSDMFDRPEEVLSDGSTLIVVAYAGGRPAATALTYVSNGVAGIQWVGTVPDARRMRLGRMVTEWATNIGFDHGASSVSLQASPMGAPLYSALGYETAYRYVEYVRWKPAGSGD